MEHRKKAAAVFERLMGHETKVKKAGGDSVNSWKWEEAVREILGPDVAEERVRAIASKLRSDESPYKVENYIVGNERFEKLLDRFDAMADE